MPRELNAPSLSNFLGLTVRRLTAAVLIAPTVGGLLAAILLALIFFPEEIFYVLISDSVTYRLATPYEVLETLGRLALLGAMLGALIGIPAMLLGGLPAHAWLLSRRRTSLVYYASVGAFVGLTAAAAFCFFEDPNISNWLFEVQTLLLALIMPGIVAGGIAATLFWLISRPDRALAN